MDGVGQGDLFFDFQGSEIVDPDNRGSIVDKRLDGAIYNLDDPLFQQLDNLVYFFNTDNNPMEKRTYVGGTWQLLEKADSQQSLTDTVLAEGTVDFMTLFLMYGGPLENTGFGELTCTAGTAFCDEVISGFGGPELAVEIASIQSPVYADNPG